MFELTPDKSELAPQYVTPKSVWGGSLIDGISNDSVDWVGGGKQD